MKNTLPFLGILICLICYNETFGQQDVTVTTAQSGDSKNTVSQGPSEVITGTLIRISPKLSTIKPVLLTPNQFSVGKEDEQDVRDGVNKNARIFNGDPNAIDKSVQRSTNSPNFPNAPNIVMQSFDGNGSVENQARGFGLLVPPDPVVTVGPNHIVQMINLVHRVYNKAGTALTSPLKFSEIAGTATDNGDPIALYDQMADRWVLMQFSNVLTNGQESLILCISQTNDPTGAYFVYEFKTAGFLPDYPHMGIWSNSFTMTTHNFNTSGSGYQSQGYWAFDRKKMLNGDPTAKAVLFRDAGSYGYLPASIEGLKIPDPTAMPTFINYDLTNQLKIRTLTLNFSNLGASALSAPIILPVATFNPNVSSVPQNSPGYSLDALGGRIMSRVIYRKFDTYESMVLNHTVDADPTATFQASPRWYELTRPNAASPWVVNQQSTYAPDALHRWMACAGIDQRGNIALGYSRSSAANNPDIYWAERKKADALSTLGTEQIFKASTGVQQSTSGRWGDYSAMAIDPADEETLWYTNEYYATTSDRGFSTRIGSFKITDPLTSPTVHFAKGGTIARQVESITPASGLPNFPFKDYPITIQIDNAPSQPVNITLTKTGTATEGTDYNILNASALVLNGTTLSQSFTLRVYDDGQFDEPNEFIDFTYTLNVNGGNAIVGLYNQQHRVTIIGKPICPPPFVSYTCSGSVATLTAVCGKGTPTWYDATGTTTLFTGSPFTTPTLAGATTYTIKCVGNDCGLFPYKVTVFPTQIYVKSDAKGSNTGADWNNAYTELSSALNLACNSSLTEVWVAKGTYRPTFCTSCDLTDAAKNVSFNIPSGKKVYGGFAGNEVNLSDRNLALVNATNLTILSGDLRENDGVNFTNTDDNSKIIVKFIGSNANTLLDGFTIKGGNGILEGGGVNIASGSSPQLTNCVITENNVSGYLLDQQSTTFGTSGNAVTTTSFGGQTFTPTITGSLTKADINLFCSSCTGTTPDLTLSVRATSGGLPTGADLATATITGFSAGSAIYYMTTFASPATLTAGTQYALVIRPTVNPSAGSYAIVRSGTSTAGSDVYAGGTRVTGATSGTVWSIPLTGGVSTDGAFRTYMVSSAANGGGIQNNGTLTLTNSVLSKNGSISNGGAIYNAGTLNLINATINANTAILGGAIFNNSASGVSTLSNVISFGNTNSYGNAGGGITTASYSLFDNMTNVVNGGNNITTAISPFISVSDLHLACTSQAVNVGTATNAPLKDFEGKARPFVGAVSLVDMGAYEFQGDLTFSANSNSPLFTGTTLNLTTAGGTSYAWTGPNGFTSTLQNPVISTVTLAATGTYTVSISYGSSCAATATTVVTVNVAAPTGTNNPTICNNSTASLTATCAPGATSTWYNASSVPIPFTGSPFITPNLTTNTTYKVRCEIGAITSPFVNVLVSVNPSPAAPVITANGPTTFCNGGSVILNSNVPNTNNSLSFVKANSQYVTIPHSASINLVATFTMEAWVNYSGINCTIVDKGDYDFLWELNANGNANKLGFYIKNTNTWVYSTSAVPQNTWTHVAITLNAGTLTFYINGVASGAYNSVTNLQDTQPMNIGRQQPTSCACNHFNGKMDELRLWNVVKTQGQIQADMNKKIPANSAGLVAYYRFDEVSGNIAADATVNGNNGTLMNGPTWDSPPTTTPITSPNYWVPGAATTQFFSVSVGGTYTSNITNEYGCTNSATVVINNLNPSMPIPQESAYIPTGGSVSLTATGCAGSAGTYILKWYKASDNTLATMPVSPATTTNYYTKCEQTFNSVPCLSMASVNVSVNVGDIVNSIITGDWENASTWFPPRVPLPTDVVIINNHTVTITTNLANAKGVELKIGGVLNYLNVGAKLKVGF